MKIACIGGGPAGLYLGILVKRVAPEHDIVVYERNRPGDTFGFGVVFSDATLGHLGEADPETHREITDRFARWDDIEIHAGGEVLRSTGHGFCGIERKQLLQILQARAKELGVRVEYEHEIVALAEVSGADVIVACDGVASWVRDALAAELRPAVDVRPNKFVWLGCTVPYRAFTFIFKQTQHGLFRVHAYRYHEHGSTFIVECREDTWRAAGLATADEDRTLAILGDIFAAELAGAQLVKNRSIWRNFPTVRCGKWHAGNVVLLGDAAHTAHFSIGSGTKLALEDAIALRDELLGTRDTTAALAKYEAVRRPEVEALQAAAQASLEWFEGTERYMSMAPVQLTYSLMTRSLRVSHASVAKRDPHLAHGVERLLAASVGVVTDPPPPPTALPLTLGDRRTASRVIVAPTRSSAPDDDQLVALGGAAAQGAAIVATAPLPASALDSDEAAVAWTRIVEYVHGKSALILARILASTDANDAASMPRIASHTVAGSDAASHPVAGRDAASDTIAGREAASHAAPVAHNGAGSAALGDADALRRAIERAAFVDFDLLVLDPGRDPHAIERLPAAVAAARSKWRRSGWLGAVVHDLPNARAAAVGHAAQLVRAGVDFLWVTSAPAAAGSGGSNARLPAATLADRLRNELDIATCVDAGNALVPDLDAALAAGRADLVIVDRFPTGLRH